ncbi:MAG: ATP-binding cassette domain-containing protein [Firmicutes bacterium]|nr:ATP-binding cassette domain-containing protein [Bacillota bacterium]
MSLKVDKLSKRLSSKVKLEKISFEMTKPGIFGIIGESGSGKTDLIRMILNLIPPEEGTVSFNEAPIIPGDISIGYLPEKRGLYMKSDVLEQLVYFAMLRGMNKRAAVKSARNLLARLGMSDLEQVLVERLDKDEREKVQFLTSIVHEPKLILLDEPFRTANPRVITELMDLMKELAAEGRYIVMASKAIEVAEACCENLVILYKGKPVIAGNLKEIKHAYGHTNLVLAADVDVTDTAIDFGMELIEKRPLESEFRIQGDEMAQTLLEHMVSQGFHPTKYEIREPSLQEIYLSTIGGQTK